MSRAINNYKSAVREGPEYGFLVQRHKEKDYTVVGSLIMEIQNLIAAKPAYAALRKPICILSLILQETQQAEEAKVLAAAEGLVEQNKSR